MKVNQSPVSKVYYCIIFCHTTQSQLMSSSQTSLIYDAYSTLAQMVPKIHGLHYDTIPNFVRAEIVKQLLIFCSSQFPYSCEYEAQNIGALLSLSCQASRTKFSFFTIIILNYFVTNSLCKKLPYPTYFSCIFHIVDWPTCVLATVFGTLYLQKNYISSHSCA